MSKDLRPSTLERITTQEMADSIGIIRRTIAKHIRSLQDKGIIKRIGPDKGGYWEVVGD